MIEALFNCAFVRDLLSNLCAGLLLLLLAVVLGFLADRKLHFYHLALQQRERKRQAILRAIRYLKLLQVNEIAPLVRDIPGWLEKIGEEYQIQTPLWFGVVRQGGELAGVANPTLLSTLATFYQGLVYAKRGVNHLLESWLVEAGAVRLDELRVRQDRFKEMQKEGLQQAREYGEGLTAEIHAEIERLKTDLAKTGLPASEIKKLEEELEAIEAPSG